jgi:hypothetical protein
VESSSFGDEAGLVRHLEESVSWKMEILTLHNSGQSSFDTLGSPIARKGFEQLPGFPSRVIGTNWTVPLAVRRVVERYLGSDSFRTSKTPTYTMAMYHATKQSSCERKFSRGHCPELHSAKSPVPPRRDIISQSPRKTVACENPARMSAPPPVPRRKFAKAKKLLIRISPLVRINKSGSGHL